MSAVRCPHPPEAFVAIELDGSRLWVRPEARARVGVEVMDTRAACRTYNILVAEGRKVAAALIL